MLTSKEWWKLVPEEKRKGRADERPESRPGEECEEKPVECAREGVSAEKASAVVGDCGAPPASEVKATSEGER